MRGVVLPKLGHERYSSRSRPNLVRREHRVHVFSPGTVTNFVKPGQDTYVKVLTVAGGQAPPQGAISADEIVQFVGRV